MTTASAHPRIASRGGFTLAVVCLSLACAHAPPALVITGDMLHAAKLSFVGTKAGMRAADNQRLLTREQVLTWNVFEQKFDKSWGAACDLWEAAEVAQDKAQADQAAAIIAALLGELGTFSEVLASTRAADGGTP